jgi:HPt (histidine-containing phosphotransfer) domain-containing protein
VSAPKIKKAASDAVLDLTDFAELWDHDVEAMSRSLQIFADSLTADFDLLNKAIATGDVEETHLLAHRIMGAARIVGGHQLAQSSEAVQNASRAGDWSGVALEMPRLSAALRDVVQAIRDMRGAGSA